MKETSVICDGCGKTETSLEGYPYEKEWVYLYNFNGQFPNQPKNKDGQRFTRAKRLEIQDKHFCCKKCMVAYLDLVIRKEEAPKVEGLKKEEKKEVKKDGKTRKD